MGLHEDPRRAGQPRPRARAKHHQAYSRRSRHRAGAGAWHFSVEVLTPRGLVRYAVLFVIDLKSRRVHIAGIVHEPYGAWMAQMARNQHVDRPRGETSSERQQQRADQVSGKARRDAQVLLPRRGVGGRIEFWDSTGRYAASWRSGVGGRSLDEVQSSAGSSVKRIRRGLSGIESSTTSYSQPRAGRGPAPPSARSFPSRSPRQFRLALTPVPRNPRQARPQG